MRPACIGADSVELGWPKSGFGATASCGLFGDVGGIRASSALVEGPTFGSTARASCGLLGDVVGIRSSSALVVGARFGSGAIACAWAAMLDPRIPAAMRAARLVFFIPTLPSCDVFASIRDAAWRSTIVARCRGSDGSPFGGDERPERAVQQHCGGATT